MPRKPPGDTNFIHGHWHDWHDTSKQNYQNCTCCKLFVIFVCVKSKEPVSLQCRLQYPRRSGAKPSILSMPMPGKSGNRCNIRESSRLSLVGFQKLETVGASWIILNVKASLNQCLGCGGEHRTVPWGPKIIVSCTAQHIFCTFLQHWDNEWLISLYHLQRDSEFVIILYNFNCLVVSLADEFSHILSPVRHWNRPHSKASFCSAARSSKAKGQRPRWTRHRLSEFRRDKTCSRG